MRAEQLLAEVEPLTFTDRCRRLAALRDDPEVTALVRNLATLDHYGRSLALMISVVTRDEAYLAVAVGDPDAELAGRAITAAAQLGYGEEMFGPLIEDAPAATRKAAYRAIRRWRRRDLAESLIDPVRARWGDEEAASLLPTCGADIAGRLLPELAHAVPNWAALAKAHPVLMLDYAERELAEVPAGLLYTWWWRHGPGVAAVVAHAPERVIGLLERHRRRLPAALVSHLGRLIRTDPARMLALLLVPEQRDFHWLRRRSVREAVARMPEEQVSALARAVREDETALRLLLLAFPPSRRESVLDAAMSNVDLTTWEFGDDLLEVLPTARRTAEALRTLGLSRVAEHPHRNLELTAFLPYDQAAPVLHAVIRRTDAADRAEGYRLLIGCAGRSRDPEVLTTVLESLGRLRNEQDPVRVVAMKALATMPATLIRPVHVPAFAQFVDDALAARDCSYQTRYELVRLATRVFEQGAIRDDLDLVTFALESFEQLAGHQGTIYLGRLDRMLRRGQEHDLVSALAGRLTDQADLGRFGLALVLVRGLGRRAHDVPELQDILERAVGTGDHAVARQAIGHWLAPPKTRGVRVAKVVASDISTVTLDTVFHTIARDRTDLLHLVLDGRPPKGRFWQHGRYVPWALIPWMRRWTSGQRGLYLRLLHEVAADPKSTESERAQVVRTIAAVPGVTAGELRPYLQSTDRLLRRTALTAAVWTSTPQDVLAELLSQAGSDDAHVAVYAAARAARFTRPSAITIALTPVLADGKITARKEALRLLLLHRAPGAAEVIATAWDDPAQHRDVRAAIASTARQYLGEPACRQIVAEAAQGPGDVARQVLGAAPLQLVPAWREFYAGLVVKVARSADAQVRDEAIRLFPAWVPWAPDATSVTAGIITDLTGTGGWSVAADSLIACAVAGYGLADLRSCVIVLGTAPDEPNAEPERDLPARQRLAALAMTARLASHTDPARARPVAEALSETLPEPLAAQFAAATLHWDGTGLDQLANRVTAGVLAIRDIANALVDSPLPVEPERILPHALRLVDREDLTGGLFACALVARHGRRAGWPDEWRGLLKRLRAHPDPDVAYIARTIFTAAEQDGPADLSKIPVIIHGSDVSW
jgi:hypothetical protein